MGPRKGKKSPKKTRGDPPVESNQEPSTTQNIEEQPGSSVQTEVVDDLQKNTEHPTTNLNDMASDSIEMSNLNLDDHLDRKIEKAASDLQINTEITKVNSEIKKPVLFTYPSRHKPRQPFMNESGQPTSTPPVRPTGPGGTQTPVDFLPSVGGQTDTPITHPPTYNERRSSPVTIGRLPTPPSYYRTGVEQQQPDMPPRYSSQYPGEMQRSAFVQSPFAFQPSPGQMTIMPNNLINVAYWAPYPRDIPANIPACLAHLVAADALFIIQRVDLLELIVSLDEPNFYLIQNRAGQCVYYAYETSNLCAQFCCRHERGFQLHIMDMYNNEIIYMNRPCGCYHYFCCYPVMEVYSPPLVPVGAVIKKFHPVHEKFMIVDADENDIFKIRGPCCISNCCLEVQYTVHALDKNETEVGVIRREYGGFVRSFLTNADYYAITFPVDLDVRIKAVFLGALFLISLKRTGWVLRNVEDPETVSGHMYRMSVMTFLIPESSGIDKTRCMKLSIVHDLAECIVGDLTPFCGVEPSEKHRQEDAAMKKLTQMIGDNGVEIYKLYKEYEAQITEESKFVKDLDRLDMILQAYEYEKIINKPGKLEEFFTNTVSKFHFPWTIDIVKEIYRQRSLLLKQDKV